MFCAEKTPHLGDELWPGRLVFKQQVVPALKRNEAGAGDGGGAHTLREWFDCSNRDLGLKRILLVLLTLTGVQE